MMKSAPKTLEELDERASRPTDGVNMALGTISGDILVLGAGGKMGFHLSAMIKRSLNQIGSNHRIIAVSRFSDADSTRSFEKFGIDMLSMDLMDEGAMDLLPPATEVFFLAGVKFGTDASPDLLQRTNVELPQRVASRFCDGRIVALSTGCVYPFVNAESSGSIETDEVAPQGEYARSCVQREIAFTNGRADVSRIRLNYSVDLRYGVLVDIARNVFEGKPVDVSTGFANVIWQGDANAYIVASLACAAKPSFVLNVTGSRTLGIRDVARQFGKLFGKKVEFLGEENTTAWLSNAAKCHETFGPPRVDENRLIQWVADWVAGGGQSLNKPTHFEVRDGKY